MRSAVQPLPPPAAPWVAPLPHRPSAQQLAQGRISVQQLDLADLCSVKAAADALAAALPRLDLLLLNAGVMACPAGRTKDGFEMQVGGWVACPCCGGWAGGNCLCSRGRVERLLHALEGERRSCLCRQPPTPPCCLHLPAQRASSFSRCALPADRHKPRGPLLPDPAAAFQAESGGECRAAGPCLAWAVSVLESQRRLSGSGTSAAAPVPRRPGLLRVLCCPGQRAAGSLPPPRCCS